MSFIPPLILLALAATAPTLAAESASPASGQDGEEIFTLADGREITGVHDADAGVIRIRMGRMTGAIPVAEADIVERRPAATTQPSAAPVRLTLRDGRVLEGHYDEEAGTLTLLGRIAGVVRVASDDIVRREVLAPEPTGEADSSETGTDQAPTDATKDRSDALAGLITELQQSRAMVIELRDARSRLTTELAEVERLHAADLKAKESVAKDYQTALDERDAFIAENTGKDIPTHLQEPVAENERLLRTLTINLQRQERDLTTLREALDQNEQDLAMWVEYVATNEQAVETARQELQKESVGQ